MSDARANAMLSELQEQVKLMSTRATLLAAELAAANGRIAELTAPKEEPPADNVTIAPETEE